MTDNNVDQQPTPLFTVFTATYNRAHTLPRVYDSLSAQTLQNFEWLLVDDGSTDETRELVNNWQKRARFSIRYFRQSNSGKHVAYNRAISEARGFLFTILDSDDSCVPQSLERFFEVWRSIPADKRAQFAGVGARCRDQHGSIVGKSFPAVQFDAGASDVGYRYRISGEKWGALLTDIARQYPFPVVAGTKFVPEGVVWNEISKSYLIRWVNEPLRVYYRDDEATGGTLSRRGLLENAPGKLYYCTWTLNNDLRYFALSPLPFVKAAVLLPLVAIASRVDLFDAWRELISWKARALVLAMCPLALFMGILDYLKRRGD